MSMIKRLLIVSNTPSSNTLNLAAAVLTGATNPAMDAIHVQHLEPLLATADDVLVAKAIIIGTTENFGYMSGALKDFFERIYYPCLEHTQGLPWALFVRAGNDGQGALTSVQHIVTGLRWREVNTPLIMTGAWQPQFSNDCNKLGLFMAAGLDAGVF
ncbi:MAG: flavodoxin family protein [Granulosicoccus sp.]